MTFNIGLVNGPGFGRAPAAIHTDRTAQDARLSSNAAQPNTAANPTEKIVGGKPKYLIESATPAN
jgi:hypothetical protein